MKRLLGMLLLAGGALTLWSGSAQASGAFGLIPGCGCCYCQRGEVTFRQYNAFTPICCGVGPGDGHGHFLPGCSPPYVAGSAWGLYCGPGSGYVGPGGDYDCKKSHWFHWFHHGKHEKHGACPGSVDAAGCSGGVCDISATANQSGADRGNSRSATAWAPPVALWMGYGSGAPGYGGMPSGYPMQGYGWAPRGMIGGGANPMYQPVGYTPTPGAQGWAMPAYWYNPGSR